MNLTNRLRNAPLYFLSGYIPEGITNLRKHLESLCPLLFELQEAFIVPRWDHRCNRDTALLNHNTCLTFVDLVENPTPVFPFL